MSIISYKEYKIENDENYFAKNNMLLEMAQLGDSPRLPVLFDDDEIEFLVQFPTSYWGMALWIRYNTFLRKALLERCKQRLNTEIAIFNEIEKITKEFIKKTYESYYETNKTDDYKSHKIQKDMANDIDKERLEKHIADITERIEINFESIKNLPETRNLKIRDEDLNFIKKETLAKWFNDVVAIKLHKKEELGPYQQNGVFQTIEAFENKPINNGDFKGIVELQGYEFPFTLTDFQFKTKNGLLEPKSKQTLIKNIKYLNNKNQIEIEYYPEVIESQKNISKIKVKVSYDYDSYDEEAVESFSTHETYNLIKKYMPFPVATNDYDPNKEDVYDFERDESEKTHGEIGAKSFIIRLIAKLEQDRNEPHFEGSGLEGSTGKYGYDLSGGHKKGIISCTDENGKYEFFGFKLPSRNTFEKNVKNFLRNNYHEIYGDTHEFKKYNDCLGKIRNDVFERPFDVVILAEYHIKNLVKYKKDILNIEKFIESKDSNVEKMKEELKQKYGVKRYVDALLKIKKLIGHYANSNSPMKTTEEQRANKEEIEKMVRSDKSIKDLFKFSDPESPVEHLPVKGLKNAYLQDNTIIEDIIRLTTTRCENKLKKSISTGNEETVEVPYSDHGKSMVETYKIYPMDEWEGLNTPSKTGKKNIFIENEYRNSSISDDVMERVGVYLQTYVNDNEENNTAGETDEIEKSKSENVAQKILVDNAPQFFRPYANKIANNIVNDLIKNEKISVPFRRGQESIHHPIKSLITHPKHYGQISNRDASEKPENLNSKGRIGNKEVFYSKDYAQSGKKKNRSLSMIKKEQIVNSTIRGEIIINNGFIDLNVNFYWNKNKIDIDQNEKSIKEIYLVDAGDKGTEIEVTYFDNAISKNDKIKKLNIKYDYITDKEEEKNKTPIAGNIVLPTQERPINWIGERPKKASNSVALVHPSQPYAYLLPKLKEEESTEPTKDNAIKENKESSEEVDGTKPIEDAIKKKSFEELMKDTLGKDYEKETLGDDERKTGHHRDYKFIDIDTWSRFPTSHGIDSGGINLNQNNPRQETHPNKTPKRMEAREIINGRKDMKYETTRDSSYLANLINSGFNNDYIKSDDDIVVRDTIKDIKEGLHRIRSAIADALGLVYNKWGKSKRGNNLTKSGKKIIKCFYAFVDHCEESIDNNLRNPIVSYKETDNEEENEKNRKKFKNWLVGKLISELQKSEIKDCITPWTRRRTNYVKPKSTGQEADQGDEGSQGDTEANQGYEGSQGDTENRTDTSSPPTDGIQNKKKGIDTHRDDVLLARAKQSENIRNFTVNKFKKAMASYVKQKIKDSNEPYSVKKVKVRNEMEKFIKENENDYDLNSIVKDNEMKKMIEKIFQSNSKEEEEFMASILGEKLTAFEPTEKDEPEMDYTTTSPPPAAKLGSTKAFRAAAKAAAAQQQKPN